MKQPTWRPEDGQLLQRLREKAGIDVLVFAQMNTLSTTQLKELENGKGNSFYNEQIKRSTGLKLLKKLGHEAPLPDSAANSPEAAQEGAPDTASVAQTTVSGNGGHGAAPLLAPRSKTKGFSWPTWGWLLFAALLASLVLFGRDWANTIAGTIAGTGAQPQPQQSAAHLPPVVPANLASESPAINSPDPVTAGSAALNNSIASAAPPPAEPTATAEASPQVGQAPATTGSPDQEEATAKPLAPVSCAAQHRQGSASHTPTAPLRLGNYIYFEALESAQLCVLDAQNKLTTTQLDAGMKRRINGEAPFLVHASNWNHLKMFYQGRRVQTGETVQQHMVLNSEVFEP